MLLEEERGGSVAGARMQGEAVGGRACGATPERLQGAVRASCCEELLSGGVMSCCVLCGEGAVGGLACGEVADKQMELYKQKMFECPVSLEKEVKGAGVVEASGKEGEMKMESKPKVKVEKLKALSVENTEMELRVQFLKAEIEGIVESLDVRLMATMVEKGELEDEMWVKKMECDLMKEKEDISIGNFGNRTKYAHMGGGIQAQALASSCRHHNDWVIDSGASKHVTDMSNSFKTYSPYTHSESVQIADGSSQLIHGVGSVECTPSLSLSLVLHVSSFPVNLLSVSSIIDQFKCTVILW